MYWEIWVCISSTPPSCVHAYLSLLVTDCTAHGGEKQVRDADLDADGQINYEEFVAMLQVKIEH